LRLLLIDTCQGDSGGPLMMFTTSQQWVLVGLTSSGIGCAEASYSGMYTRVAAFQSWISANTNVSSPKLPSSVYGTESSSIQTNASTTSAAMVYLHANMVETSIFTIFIYVSFNLFLAFLY
jgi:secreted trypsin-like serine protease